jgi:CBS domain containing-hemolysin-like protein
MTIVYIIILLGANAFFVAAEFALVKVPAVRIDALAAAGGGAAQMTKRISENLETYLATCQLGITMASLGLGWIGEPAVAALLTPMFVEFGLPEDSIHVIAFLLGFILFSSLHIVIGEQVPKTYAIREPATVSLWVAYPLHLTYIVTYPLTWSLNLASNATLKLLGVASVSHADILSGAEIRGLISASREHGAIEASHADMMHNLFTFHDRPVERIMLPRRFIETIELGITREEMIAALSQSKHSRLAVIDRMWENFVGIVLVKEVLIAMLEDTSERPLANNKSLIREAQLIPESQPVADLFQSMQANRNHVAFAVDEYGEVSGLVTMEDLIEEIVGDISDESDTPRVHELVRKTATGWQCDGFTLLGDLERAIGVEIDPEIDANTVTGLFMQTLSRLPETGDEITVGDFRFEIKHMNGRRPVKVEITLTPGSEHEPAALPAPDPSDEGLT